MDGIRYRCRHPASSLFGPSRHCGLGLMNGPRFRYRQGLFDLLSRWPIMWTMRFVGVRRPISAFGPPDATHFYVLYQFLLQHLFSYRNRHFSSRTTRIRAVPFRSSSTSSRQASPSEASISLRRRSAVMASPLTRWMVTRTSALRRGSV